MIIRYFSPLSDFKDFLLRPSGTSSKGGYEAAWLSPFGGGGRRSGEDKYNIREYGG